jgi:hypothetical protein
MNVVNEANDAARLPARPASRRSRSVSVVVTVALVVLAGVLAVTATKLVSDRGPVVSGGRADPVGGPVPTGSPAPAVRPPAAPSDAAVPPAGTDVRIGTLTVTVPAGWFERSREDKLSRTTVCLTATAAGCDLWVTGWDESTQPTADLTPDTFASLATKAMAICDGDQLAVRTTAYSTTTLGDRPAEYRAYDRACDDRTRHLEQWTVPTWPPVQFSSTDRRTDATQAVHDIVASARFSEPDSGHRVMELGYIKGHSTGPDGLVHIKVDRAIRSVGGTDNGRDVNGKDTTYDYRLAPSVRVRDDGQLCADSYAVNRTCPLSTALGRLAHGDADQIVHLDFDRDGLVVEIVGEYRP